MKIEKAHAKTAYKNMGAREKKERAQEQKQEQKQGGKKRSEKRVRTHVHALRHITYTSYMMYDIDMKKSMGGSGGCMLRPRSMHQHTTQGRLTYMLVWRRSKSDTLLLVCVHVHVHVPGTHVVPQPHVRLSLHCVCADVWVGACACLSMMPVCAHRSCSP